MNDLIKMLFTAMSSDIGVMAEWGDDEAGLLNELETCGPEILREYAEIFL